MTDQRKKLFRNESWGDPEKSALGGYNSKGHNKDYSDNPTWLDMIPVKRYKRFTRYMKLCPNGECYYECFFNREIDAEKARRGMR